MVNVREGIVVEGRYDKNTLSQVVNATIFTTDGFGIFKNPEQMALLRLCAERRGLIVLTDSDGAGFVIRSRIRSAIAPQYLKHAYIPDIPGKERRKSAPGREGKLGVEGMDASVLLEALRRAGATMDDAPVPALQAIGKQDFYELGLSGRENSAARRKMLIERLRLPAHLSANALLEAVNVFLTQPELAAICAALGAVENNHG